MNCLFCKIISGEIPSRKAFENDNIYAFYDIAPQAPVHILVIPKVHIESVDGVNSENSKIIAEIFENIPRIAREAGIRPCIETDDCFVTGASLAMLGASSGGGMKRIYKPVGVKKMRPLAGRKIYAETPDYVDIYLRWRETAIFRLEY